MSSEVPPLTHQYLDFELEIGPGEGREYPVAVLRAPANTASATMLFPYDDFALETRLDKLKIALLKSAARYRSTPEKQTVKEFGAAMFDALLTGDVRTSFHESRVQARQQGKGLRLKLRITAPRLLGLPWEYLYDSEEDDYLCLSKETPIVRYLETGQPEQPLAVTPPLRILGMYANPLGTPKLDIVNEKRRLNEALKELKQRGLVEVTWLKGQTWRDLQNELRNDPWHVFHFVGHGAYDRVAGEGQLALADERGRVKPVGAEALGRLLGQHRSSLRLAFLNACSGGQTGQEDPFSSVAAAAVKRGLPAAVAMQYQITDRAALVLSRAFYEALAAGLPVEAAISEARLAINLDLQYSLEWGTPVLFMRSQDGGLFKHQKAMADQQHSKESAQPREVERRNDNSSAEVTLDLNGALSIFVHIPAGEFILGSDKQYDQQAFDSEMPQHKVYLPEYYIAKYPITNYQYRAYLDAQGIQYKFVPRDLAREVGIPMGHGDLPVVNVAVKKMLEFCEWASRVSGRAIRLLSEAEWEKAARGGLEMPDTIGTGELIDNPLPARIFPWGDHFDPKLCNSLEGGINATTAVGKYSPGGDSPYGCADMAGNVWELTNSLYHLCPVKSDENLQNTLGHPNLQVWRGGAYYTGSRFIRCAYRNGDSYYGYNYLGFRVAFSPSDPDC